jgi:transcriptional regulator with XRE-family HTH domain
MRDIESSLRAELRDPEYSEGYAESFLNAYVATQIKVIREQRGMTQADLANKIGTTQAGISRIENVDYSSWSIRTLIKLARAFGVRLKVSFEQFGTLPEEVIRFNRNTLQRVTRDEDLGLIELPDRTSEYLAGPAPVTHRGLWEALASGPSITPEQHLAVEPSNDGAWLAASQRTGLLGGEISYAASGN